MNFFSHFARPHALWLLLLLPVLIVLSYRFGKLRRSRLAQFGRYESLAILTTLQPHWRGRSRLCWLAALLMLVIGLAGPRWGRGESGLVVGRDIMIVLDLSKSMLGDDMRDPDEGKIKARWEAARAGLHDLIAYLRQRGGHRVGLVVFAAKPWLVCPLTADYEHFELRLNEFTPTKPPVEVNPDKDESFASGTSIGAAISEGVRWHDPRFLGYQDLILLSDGDDPSPDAEGEIETGIQSALTAKLPVNVVGYGDPKKSTTVIWKRTDGEEDVIGPTRLMEQRLQEIARRTHGEYLPAQRDILPLSTFFRDKIEPRPTRELPDDALPQRRDRAAWFLFAAFILLLVAWWIEP